MEVVMELIHLICEQEIGEKLKERRKDRKGNK